MFYVSPAVCFGRCCSMLLLFGFISSLCINNNVGTGWFGVSRINPDILNACSELLLLYAVGLICSTYYFSNIHTRYCRNE